MLRQVRARNRSPMTLDGTRTFVIGSSHPIVIDPGPADPDHLSAVERLLDGAVPAAILLTHAHADHSGNAMALVARTGAPLCMGRRARTLPFPPAAVVRWLRSGDEVDFDAGPLKVYETPGHTPEHLAFLWEPPGGAATLFAGDLFLGAGDTTLVSPPEGDLRDYLHSLEVVRALGPAVIYPAHGPVLRHPALAIERYVRHRMERLADVRAALAVRPDAAAEELVAVVYGETLDPRLRSAARGSIQAVINYLRHEPLARSGPLDE